MSNETNSKKYYTHSDKQEMLAFTTGYLLAAVTNDDDKNVFKLWAGETVADRDQKLAANIRLFALIIQMTRNDKLVAHLATNYSMNGKGALDYIKGCWDQGDGEDRQSDASTKYVKLVSTDLTDKTPEEFISITNDMHLARIDLMGTERDIKDKLHAGFVVDMVRNISPEHKNEVRHLIYN